MPSLLECPEPIEQQRVPEVQVLGGGIEACLDPQATPLCGSVAQTRAELILGKDLVSTALEFCEFKAHVLGNLAMKAHRENHQNFAQCGNDCREVLAKAWELCFLTLHKRVINITTTRRSGC